jgi:hypothetical protein
MSDLPGQESTSAPTVATDVTRQELPYRLRQQSLLGEFGRSALQTRDIGQILQRATELCAQGLDTRFDRNLPLLRRFESGNESSRNERRNGTDAKTVVRPPQRQIERAPSPRVPAARARSARNSRSNERRLSLVHATRLRRPATASS